MPSTPNRSMTGAGWLPVLMRVPGGVRLAVRIDIAPPGLWLLLIVCAVWPTWVWMARRMLDGSDDPLGLLALATLGLLLWRNRRRLRSAPRLAWLALALLCAAAATAAQTALAPLVVSLIALLGMAAALAAFLPPGIATAPVVGLSVLSLPLLASLQFYAGYPLRVVTAEASRWLLQAAWAVERQGSSLQLAGQRVVVDAPCSGVQMVWLGYFTACAMGLYCGRSNRQFLSRLPAVGLMVLAGNVLRNTLLVSAQASGHGLPPWGHEAVGLAVLAAVCSGIGWFMARGARRV